MIFMQLFYKIEYFWGIMKLTFHHIRNSKKRIYIWFSHVLPTSFIPPLMWARKREYGMISHWRKNDISPSYHFVNLTITADCWCLHRLPPFTVNWHFTSPFWHKFLMNYFCCEYLPTAAVRTSVSRFSQPLLRYGAWSSLIYFTYEVYFTTRIFYFPTYFTSEFNFTTPRIFIFRFILHLYLILPLLVYLFSDFFYIWI